MISYHRIEIKKLFAQFYKPSWPYLSLGVTLCRASRNQLQRCLRWSIESRDSWAWLQKWQHPSVVQEWWFHIPVTSAAGENNAFEPKSWSRIFFSFCVANFPLNLSCTCYHSWTESLMKLHESRRSFHFLEFELLGGFSVIMGACDKLRLQKYALTATKCKVCSRFSEIESVTWHNKFNGI